MPILGVIDSAKTGRLANPAYFQIATQDVSGVSTYTFSSIPQGYSHLEIRSFIKDSRSPIYSSYSLRLNSDSTASYFNEAPQIDKRGVFAPAPNPNATSIQGITNPGSSNSNYYGAGFMKLLNYSRTDRFTSVFGIGGYVGLDDGSNEGGLITQTIATWLKTDAVNSITITSGGGSWQTGSIFSLYGIKGEF